VAAADARDIPDTLGLAFSGGSGAPGGWVHAAAMGAGVLDATAAAGMLGRVPPPPPPPLVLTGHAASLTPY
jgi:hypothetical protein